MYTIYIYDQGTIGDLTVRHIYACVPEQATPNERQAALYRVLNEMEIVRVNEDQRILIHCRFNFSLCYIIIRLDRRITTLTNEQKSYNSYKFV